MDYSEEIRIRREFIFHQISFADNEHLHLNLMVYLYHKDVKSVVFKKYLFDDRFVKDYRFSVKQVDGRISHFGSVPATCVNISTFIVGTVGLDGDDLIISYPLDHQKIHTCERVIIRVPIASIIALEFVDPNTKNVLMSIPIGVINK